MKFLQEAYYRVCLAIEVLFNGEDKDMIRFYEETNNQLFEDYIYVAKQYNEVKEDNEKLYEENDYLMNEAEDVAELTMKLIDKVAEKQETIAFIMSVLEMFSNEFEYTPEIDSAREYLKEIE